jgi:DNA (cytosine-5)-methyltransferase 1
LKVTIKLLDLFCGAGGAASGYHRAGFEVTGVDLHPQPRFPFKDFHQADAVEFHFDGFDVIHASPPCQAYSKAMKHLTSGYPMLIDTMLDRLKDSGVPWVLENVPGSPLPEAPNLFGENGLLLCGSMFGLRIQRHRLFQTSFPIDPPGVCVHDENALDPDSDWGRAASKYHSDFRVKKEVMNPHNAGARKEWRKKLGSRPIERTWRDEMGVGWMDSHEGRESIPPVYTEYIGRHIMEKIRNEA